MTAHSSSTQSMLTTYWGSWLAELANKAVDVLFPPHCVICRRYGDWFCAACIAQIEFIRPPICSLCGTPLHPHPPAAHALPSTTNKSQCSHCRTHPPQFDRIVAAAFHDGPLRIAIHELKYRDFRVLSVPLGKLMADGWQSLVSDTVDFEAIVPVPLHRSRQRQRGYNQAELLARQLGTHFERPVVNDALERFRATSPQVGLDAGARRDNVHNAFRCTNSSLEGKRVLLVDDVCTTGSTLEAASVALRNGGALSIWAYTLARAKAHTGPDFDNSL